MLQLNFRKGEQNYEMEKMIKKTIEKMQYITIVSITTLATYSTVAAAEYTGPSIDVDGAQNLITDFTQPNTTIAIFAVPSLTAVRCFYLFWIDKNKTAEEQEQKPLGNQIFKEIKTALCIEIIPIVLKLLRL